jgi:hypothetical protein
MCTRIGGLYYYVAIQWGVLGETEELETARRARG